MKAMAEDEKRGELGGAGAAPDDSLRKVLEDRWDPGKLSRFMRGAQGSRGQRLDHSQRSRFERRFGADLGDVRIFSGELAEEITRAHGAEALTVGDTGMILMRQSSAFTPGTASGTALLAHELAHVVQAKPSALSFKKTETDLAEEDLSEEEAEEHEAEVKAEEQGGSSAKSQADKDQNERQRLDRIAEKVLELFHEDLWMGRMRVGVSPDSEPR
jgi:hypothetical protein